MAHLIPDAETLKTKALLAEVLIQLNADQRVKFFTSRGRGGPTVQCLRVMLSRVRNAIAAKNLKRKHFKMHADVFPHTDTDGSRRDCIIIWRTRNSDHEVLETLEDLMSHGIDA